MARRVSWGAFSLLLAPFGAWGLGLGDIELRSGLNQPLEANIQLAATPDELSNLRVRLATPDTFDRYGLDRPAFLAGINFVVTRDEAGRSVIRMSSFDAVTEPFVTVLIEATWSQGRLLREYTVLLDPPVLLPQQAIVEPVQPPTARVPQPAAPATLIERAPQVMPAPAPSAAPSTAPVRPATAGADGGGAYGPVQRGETLWGIATQYLPAGVTMNQMMVAMYRANPNAFLGNMNVLRQGATLNIPELPTLGGVVAADATQEVLRQASEWQGGSAQQARLRLVAPELESSPAAAGAGGAGTAAVTDTAAVTELESELDAVRGELAEAQRLLELRNAELADLQTQLGEAQAAAGVAPEQPIAEPPAAAEPGVDLESEDIFVDDDEPLVEEVEEPELAPDIEAEAEDETPAVTPPPRVVTTQQPSLVSRLLGWLTTPLVWMIAGLAALIGAGAWYLRSRQAEGDETGRWEALDADDFESREATERMRKRVRAEDETFVVEEQHTQELEQPAIDLGPTFDEQHEPTAEVRRPKPEKFVPVADVDDLDLDLDLGSDLEPEPSPKKAPTKTETRPSSKGETSPSGRFTKEETLSSSTVINLDQADPMAEADFHMAYGLYDQAADLVSRALEADPDNRALRLKLLEVYFVWGNREAFLESAQALRASIGRGSNPDWDKVVIMGKQICPDEALFADATAAAGSVDLDLAAGDSPALDLAFDDTPGGAVDLDLSSDDVSLELERTGDRASSTDVFDIGEDLEIGDKTAAGLEAAFFMRPSDPSEKTSPNLDIDEALRAQEAADSTSDTLESPTVEIGGPDSPTVELSGPDSPTVIGPDAPTMESPHLGPYTDDSTELPTVEQPKLDMSAAEASDQTAEIDLDDLGLDVDEFGDLGDEPADTRDRADADVLSATGVTKVLSAGNSAAADDDDDMLFARTEVLPPDDDDDTGATASFRMPKGPKPSSGGSGGLDLDLDDLAAALDGGDTVEHPMRSKSFGADVFGDDGAIDLDLDVGSDAVGPDAPTGKMLSDQTLTEVGTKLDLARAYIDMGDPEGARSILEEVLDEGDSAQRQEAKSLIDAL
jgi:pilus assembly protein FimV